jgi:hypothetical protein
VRFLLTGIISVFMAASLSAAAQDQPSPPAAQTEDQYFSGDVTAIDATKITVKRTVLGKRSDVKTFLITAETRVEGKPKVKSRVTVRWVPGEQGDRAVHILVRAGKK